MKFIEHKVGLPKSGEAHDVPEQDHVLDLDDEFIERFIGPVEGQEDMPLPPGSVAGVVCAQADRERYSVESGEEGVLVT